MRVAEGSDFVRFGLAGYKRGRAKADADGQPAPRFEAAMFESIEAMHEARADLQASIVLLIVNIFALGSPADLERLCEYLGELPASQELLRIYVSHLKSSGAIEGN
jgi:hypothetical protein